MRDFYGNFEKATGYPVAARSQAFSLWSGFHAKVLERGARALFFLLMLSPLALAWAWKRAAAPERRRHLEFAGLLLACCLAALFTVLLGDCWDNIKHFYVFNLLFDACVITGAAWVLDQTLIKPIR